MALDPLKFQVAIQDDATKQLSNIESALNSLKDKTISVKVEGLSDLQQLLSALQHQQVSNLGKDVGSAINEATKNLQKEAQDAVRTSLGNLAQDLASIKTAIQNDNFTAFSNRIQTCAEKVSLLDEAFKKFKVTIGENEELKNLLTGLGAAIREVSSAMSAMNSVKNSGGAKAQKEELKQQEEGLIRVANAIGRVRDVASGGGGASSGSFAFMESINKVGERNIQTLIKEQGHIERLIAIAKKSIDFGEGHPVLGMGRLRGDQMQNLQNLEQLKNIIKEILFAANQGDQAAIRFLNTLGSLKTVSFGKDLMGNNITLLGGHFDQLTHSVTGTATAMRQLNKDMRIDFNKAANKEKLAAEAEAVKKLAASYNSMQQESKTMRSQSESALASRIKMLREQSADLQKLLSVGKIGLGEGQYNSVRDALREIRKELQQIETITQRGGNSTGLLRSLSVGRDYSGVIATGRAVADMRNRQAQETTLVSRAVSQLTAEEQRLAQALNQATNSARGQSQVLGDLKSLATQYLGVWGAQGFLRNVIEIGGQLEMQRLSIGAILGDMAKANELFDRIKNLAVKSPFGVVELDSMTKQLSAYGFEYNELFDMTKRLADISAATGTGVDRLALALGHVRSEAALSGYTLRQFSMANIPLARKLSEELTKVEGKFVSVADVRKRVRTKDIGYEQVLKVLKDLTDEGGMFYNAQEIMSESVKARFKNLKDSMDIMYGEIAESSVGGGLKSVAEMLTTLTRHWQELGAVLVTGAGYWAINRLAMLANNKAIVQGNLVLGRFSAAQLEMQATTGNLTRAQLLQAVATKKLAVADAEAAAAVLGLSRAQLQHVANTGKVSAAMNIATLATSKYTVAQLRTIATMRGMNLGWLATGFFGVKNGLVAATTAAWGFMKAMWPMLAISALVELFVSLKRESEAFAESANYVGQSARQMITDIDNVLKTVAKNGKPLDAESLREAVNTMREVVEQSEFYTAEQQNQVDNAISLSQKYDILLQQLKDMREESEWLANNESLIQKMLSNTGKEVVTGAVTSEGVRRDFGVPFFNDSIIENMDQVTKANSELDAAVSLLAEYQNVMATAIEKNNSFGLSLDGKSWQEQIKMIAESGHWEEFVNSVDNAGSRFKDTAENVKNASDDVRDKWDEVVKDDLKAIMVTMEQYLKTDEEGVKSWAQTNEKAVKFMADGIARALKLSEKNIEKFMKFFYELFGLEYNGRATQKVPTEYEKQTDLGKQILGNVIRHNRNNGKNGNGVMTVKDVNDLVGTGEHEKSPSEVVKAIKERAQKDLQTMKDVEKIYGTTSTEYKKAEKDYKKSLNIAESNGISEDEIKTGKLKDKKDSKGKSEDKDARRLREIVKLYKDAYDWYGKYEKQVGEGSALAKVKEQFQPLFDEFRNQWKQSLSLDSIPEYKQNLETLLSEAQKLYESPKHKNSYMVEAIKTIRDAINNVDYEEAQRKMDEYASKVQIELDTLTRKWDMFNDVRESTGNLELAVRISGVGGDGTRNLADDLKKKIQTDLAQIGVDAIPFDFNLSDKDIKKEVENAFESFKPQKPADENDKKAMKEYNDKLSEYQSKIKGFIEIYKKWRDLQRDVTAKDLKIFADLLGKTEDYGSKLNQLRNKLSQTLDSISLSNGSQEDKNLATRRAIASEEWEEAQLSADFANLFNNAVSMSKNAFESEASYIEGLLNDLFELGLISPEKMNEWRDKVTKARSDYSTSGFLGIKGSTGAFLAGGYQGLIDYRKSKRNNIKEELSRLDPKSKEYKDKEKELKVQDQLIKKYEKAAKSMELVMNAANTLKGGLDLLSDLFNNMGATGMGTAMSDASGVLGSAMSGASSLSALGPWGMAAGAGLGLLGGLFGLHDKALQREIERLREDVQKIENNTDLIVQARERTFGYDNGDLRRSYAQQYAPNEARRQEFLASDDWFNRFLASTAWGQGFDSEAQKAMYEYYQKNSVGTGYQQELANLKAEREDYMRMYDAENEKKNSSGEALEEYRKKIAEIDDQILYFTEDLAKELWGIDLKGWANQISDSLWTAFENGEDALKAFHETAKDIIADVAKRMMNIHLIEPVMAKLEEALFGKIGANGERIGGGAYNMQTGKFNERETLEILGQFFGEGGEFAKVIESAETFYDMAKRVTGFDFGSDSGGSVSSGIKGVTEQTADLLASYVNAIRADVSVIRAMIAQYFPMYYQALTSGNDILRGIENHTAAIMRSNEAIEKSNQAILDRIDGLKNNTWRVPVV